MGLITRSAIAASAAIGLGISSQAPEFAQQYAQRLGGAVDELRAVVEDFDSDARASDMDRQGALDMMSSSEDRFSRDRGESMKATIARYQRLVRQQERLESAAPAMRPIIVMQYPDPKIVQAAWQDYDPAVPLTGAGASYGGAGGVVLALLTWLGIGAGRRTARIRRERRMAARSTPASDTREVGSGPL